MRKQTTFVIGRKRVKELNIDTSLCSNSKSHYTCILRYCNRKQLMPEIYIKKILHQIFRTMTPFFLPKPDILSSLKSSKKIITLVMSVLFQYYYKLQNFGAKTNTHLKQNINKYFTQLIRGR